MKFMKQVRIRQVVSNLLPQTVLLVVWGVCELTPSVLHLCCVAIERISQQKAKTQQCVGRGSLTGLAATLASYTIHWAHPAQVSHAADCAAIRSSPCRQELRAAQHNSNHT